MNEEGELVPSGNGHGNGHGHADPSGAAKVGRNDPCPCGSGKKYKRCHGAHASA